MTERTVKVSRELGVAEEDIDWWVEAKQELDSKRAALIEPELNQAQSIACNMVDMPVGISKSRVRKGKQYDRTCDS